MAEQILNVIDLIHPTVSGLGVIVTDQIWVLFNCELDETTIAGGNFFVSGPDFDTWSGPDLQTLINPSDPNAPIDLLESPGFHGTTQGEITFERIALDSLNVVTTEDTIGSGHLYRTKAIFTPTNRLAESTEYRVHLSGDEDEEDTLQTGLSSRTVFDVVASGNNTGTGEVELTGGYTGLYEDVYYIVITTGGERGTARFTFTRSSDLGSVFGPFRTKLSGVLLSDGVTAEFTEGQYEVGDRWSVVVKPRDVFLGNLVWPFKTGSGSIVTIPDTISTSVIGDPISDGTLSTVTELSNTLDVLSIDPEDGTSNLHIIPGIFQITVDFNQALDEATVLSGIDIGVFSGSVDGSSDIHADGDLIVRPVVSGVHLYLLVASGQLHQNNLVEITLDKSITSSNGYSLGTNHTFSFTTEYYPMYCTLRRIRLSIGAYIENVADDTINLAIYLASLEADNLTWNKSNLEDDYYQFARGQWTCCRASQTLLINTTGSPSLKSKKLGDLQVDYDTSRANNNLPLKQVETCLQKWEGVLLAGGRQVQTPVMTIKGATDPDRIPCGRGWTDDEIGMPAANGRTQISGSRRVRRYFNHRGWWQR